MFKKKKNTHISWTEYCLKGTNVPKKPKPKQNPKNKSQRQIQNKNKPINRDLGKKRLIWKDYVKRGKETAGIGRQLQL